MKKPQGWELKGKKLEERSKRLPLSAPTKKEQDFYEKYVKKVKKNTNALILGATPEPRDIAIRYGIKSYAVDISQSILDKYTNLMQFKENPNNITINNDWLKMDFKDEFFSIIMGDGSLNNLPLRKQNEDLLKILSNLIVPKGYLLVRQIILNKKAKPLSSKKLVGLYRKNKLSFYDLFGELRLLRPMYQFFNKKTFQVKSEDAFNMMEEYYHKGILNDEEKERLFAYNNKLINTIYPEEEFIKMFKKKGFKLIELFIDTDFTFTRYLRIYAFQKI